MWHQLCGTARHQDYTVRETPTRNVLYAADDSQNNSHDSDQEIDDE